MVQTQTTVQVCVLWATCRGASFLRRNVPRARVRGERTAYQWYEDEEMHVEHCWFIGVSHLRWGGVFWVLTINAYLWSAQGEGDSIFSNLDSLWTICNRRIHSVEIMGAGVDVYDKAISLCGMSKVFAMPGTRVGWYVAVEGLSCVCIPF